ncbi:MAG: hypothetical protein PHR21_05495 [Oscillospiraceae bacterium]|nr:hypothetical protein [Oscillospiraceae bacterium]MDD4369169.1 hypothetical protein [Oscillospiraceae bacterium]
MNKSIWHTATRRLQQLSRTYPRRSGSSWAVLSLFVLLSLTDLFSHGRFVVLHWSWRQPLALPLMLLAFILVFSGRIGAGLSIPVGWTLGTVAGQLLGPQLTRQLRQAFGAANTLSLAEDRLAAFWLVGNPPLGALVWSLILYVCVIFGWNLGQERLAAAPDPNHRYPKK